MLVDLVYLLVNHLHPEDHQHPRPVPGSDFMYMISFRSLLSSAAEAVAGQDADSQSSSSSSSKTTKRQLSLGYIRFLCSAFHLDVACYPRVPPITVQQLVPTTPLNQP